jgi:glutamate/aspartate transport system substrate-binding protein
MTLRKTKSGPHPRVKPEGTLLRDMLWEKIMKNAIAVVAAACLLAGAFEPTKAQDLQATLKKVKETGTITIGHRDSSLPLSYLDDKLQPVGFSIDLCKHVVEAVRAKLGIPDLKVAYNPVTSATRIPLVANGTVDIECGSTANMTARQKQVGFSYTFFVPQFKWIARAGRGINTADDLRGKTVAVTAGTNTALFVNKMNNADKLGLTIMSGKDHAESFLLVETGRANAWMEDDILLAGFRANAKSPAEFKLLDRAYPSDPYALMMRKDDAPFKGLVDETLARLMRSGEFERLYARWFESPIPPRGINIQLPMSDALKRDIREPNDKPNS